MQRYPDGIAHLLGYELRILWPLLPLSGHENDHSCVIKLEKMVIQFYLPATLKNKVKPK